MPPPCLVSWDAVASPIAPPTVRLCERTETILLFPSVTAPVPRFKSLLPMKVKPVLLPPVQLIALLPASVSGAPVVLSMNVVGSNCEPEL